MRFRVAVSLSLALAASTFWPVEGLQAVGTAFMYQQAVASLQSAGIIDSGSIDRLRLSDGINRAEALKVILRAQPTFASSVQGIAAAMPPLSLFSDVDQRAWYAAYIELGFRSRLITGYADGTFRPQAGVTPEEAAALIVRSFGGSARSAPFLSSDDLPNVGGQWYTDAVSVVNAANGVMPFSRLRLGYPLTRGQLFDMVVRMRLAHGSPLIAATPVSVGSGTVQTVQDGAALQYASVKPFAISIPSIGITDLTVTHPKDPFTQDGVLAPLQEGVGHLISYPGDKSKVLIYGHSSGYPWDLSQYTKIFRTINKVAVGARVYVTYKGKMHVYRVTAKKTVPAKDSSYLEPDDKGEQLILYTCWPPDSITNRFLVLAEPIETIALK